MKENAQSAEEHSFLLPNMFSRHRADQENGIAHGLVTITETIQRKEKKHERTFT